MTHHQQQVAVPLVAYRQPELVPVESVKTVTTNHKVRETNGMLKVDRSTEESANSLRCYGKP